MDKFMSLSQLAMSTELHNAMIRRRTPKVSRERASYVRQQCCRLGLEKKQIYRTNDRPRPAETVRPLGEKKKTLAEKRK